MFNYEDDRSGFYPPELIDEPIDTTQDLIDVDFIYAFNNKATQVHELAKLNGFWDESRNQAEMIALIHSELSEALEALRNGNPPDSHIPEYSGVEAELADVIIRTMDMAAGFGYRVAEAVIAKTEYNTTRPYKHGKKF